MPRASMVPCLAARTFASSSGDRLAGTRRSDIPHRGMIVRPIRTNERTLVSDVRGHDITVMHTLAKPNYALAEVAKNTANRPRFVRANNSRPVCHSR